MSGRLVLPPRPWSELPQAHYYDVDDMVRIDPVGDLPTGAELAALEVLVRLYGSPRDVIVEAPLVVCGLSLQVWGAGRGGQVSWLLTPWGARITARELSWSRRAKVTVTITAADPSAHPRPVRPLHYDLDQERQLWVLKS